MSFFPKPGRYQINIYNLENLLLEENPEFLLLNEIDTETLGILDKGEITSFRFEGPGGTTDNSLITVEREGHEQGEFPTCYHREGG